MFEIILCVIDLLCFPLVKINSSILFYLLLPTKEYFFLDSSKPILNLKKLVTSWISDRILILFCHFYFILFLKILFSHFQREGKGGRRRGRETSMHGCLLSAPYWGPGSQPRHVPWLVINQLALNPLSHTSQGKKRDSLSPEMESW